MLPVLAFVLPVASLVDEVASIPVELDSLLAVDAVCEFLVWVIANSSVLVEVALIEPLVLRRSDHAHITRMPIIKPATKTPMTREDEPD